MSYSRRSRYRSVSRSLSRSSSISRSRSRWFPSSNLDIAYRSCESSVENPGNNLYVTGLSTRITKRELEKHFSTEGKVEDIHLVVDPWTRESRGFGFVTMSSVGEADRCIKYLNGSVLEGRVITVEKVAVCSSSSPKSIQLTNQIKHIKQISDYYIRGLYAPAFLFLYQFSLLLISCLILTFASICPFVLTSPIWGALHCCDWMVNFMISCHLFLQARRRRGRTPTPGRYLGLRTIRGRRHSPSYSPYSRSRSPHYSSERGRSRSYSPYHRRRSYSPYYGCHGSYSPPYCRGRSYLRSLSPYSRSPVGRRRRSASPHDSRRERSHCPSDSRYQSPDDRYYRRSRRERSYSPYDSRYYAPDDRHYRKRRRDSSYSPYDSRRRSPADWYSKRSRSQSVSRSISTRSRRNSRQSYSRSGSPRSRRSLRRSYSRSGSPRRSRRSYSRSVSPKPRSLRSTSGGSSHKYEYSRGGHSSRSSSRSRSWSVRSRSVSKSVSSRSA
ncbi:serine/arginine-rich splicing factor SR45a-like isoform X2 [Diospyros lotus]|uniref:serine/arginine-rich splicing factor SR45a-like isoform X2 n=1 Tax=Diospyros lotus TaxID=55363 RepID=UPI00224E9FBA|nr:serine/arginine-rich splicing factor SR45a-like isoform X2 [Diospyros lotus]